MQVIGPCASVSLVGRNIRAILHQLGDAFEFFAEQKIYLVSQAANDLNFTFVVDENQGDRLVEQLHELLIRPVPDDRVLGPTWEQIFLEPGRCQRAAPAVVAAASARSCSRPSLEARSAAFVYDLETVRQAARALCAPCSSVARVHYSMKANAHPQAAAGAARARRSTSSACRAARSSGRCSCSRIWSRARILFTPNFAPRDEYAWALGAGRARHASTTSMR